MATNPVRYPNRLRECIKSSGYKLQEFAEETQIPLRTLHDYCSGKVPIPKKRLEIMSEMLGYPAEYLVPRMGISDMPSAVSEETLHLAGIPLETSDLDKSRREFLQQVPGLVSTVLVTPPYALLDPSLLDRLSSALAKSSSIDDMSIGDLEAIAKHYWQLRSKIAYRDLLSGFLGHLEMITQLLRYSQPSKLYKRLCSLASEVAQRIGSIFFDMHNYAPAHAYYTVAIKAAQEADNYALWAVGLGRMSSLPIYDGHPDQAIPHLQEAQYLAERNCSPMTRAWLASVKAEAYANLYDTHACFESLKQAERLVEQIGLESTEDPYGMNFNYARLLGYKGVCYLRFQRPKFALTALDEAARVIDTASIRQRSIILTDSAIAYVQRGDIQEACEYANQALRMTSRTRSELVMQRIRQFRSNIKSSWKTMNCVKDLDEQMALAHL